MITSDYECMNDYIGSVEDTRSRAMATLENEEGLLFAANEIRKCCDDLQELFASTAR